MTKILPNTTMYQLRQKMLSMQTYSFNPVLSELTLARTQLRTGAKHNVLFCWWSFQDSTRRCIAQTCTYVQKMVSEVKM
jgi:hypothetical protein